MGKTFYTKRKILDMLKSGPKTPSEMWKELDLAPSTISQHLKELCDMGEIEEGYDEHLRNIRYYRRVDSRDAPVVTARAQAFRLFGSVVAIAAVALVLMYVYSTHLHAYSSTPAPSTSYAANSTVTPFRYVQVSLTDPPQVPNGTTSLNITYSKVMAYTGNGANGGWISLNSTGKVDLMQLVNASRLLGTANLSTALSVSAVSFDILNATISIYNSTYPVIIDNGTVSVAVTNKVREGNSAILIDLSPSVTAVYGKGLIDFVLVPSASALDFNSTISGQINITHSWGKTVELNRSYMQELAWARTDIGVSNTELSSSSNSTMVLITVKDNSTVPVTLTHVVITGNEILYAQLGLHTTLDSPGKYLPINSSPAAYEIGNLSVPISAGIVNANSINTSTVSGMAGNAINDSTISAPSVNSKVDISGNTQTKGLSQSREPILSLRFNQSMLSRLIDIGHFNSSINASSYLERRFGNQTNALGQMSRVGLNSSEFDNLLLNATMAHNELSIQQRLDSISLLVSSNGTLVLPESNLSFDSIGYTLQPGQQVVLTFNGSISFDSGRVIVTLIRGSAYTVKAIGSGAAIASSTTTAR